jgi:dihydroxy-acid dehydratase
MSDEDLTCMEMAACPTCGSCSGMYTANTMNCLTEALGLGLPGNGTIPAVYADRRRLAYKAGLRVMELLEKGPTARQILSPGAIRNALRVDMALGGSTNTILHMLAIAREAGYDLSMTGWREITIRRPCFEAQSGRPQLYQCLNDVGGIQAVLPN